MRSASETIGFCCSGLGFSGASDLAWITCGGSFSDCPAPTRSAAFTRLPSRRISPLRSSFSSSVWVTAGKCRLNQRSSRMPSSSAAIFLISGINRAHDPEAGEQGEDGKHHRADDVEGGGPVLPFLKKQHAVQREGREGGVAAQDAGGEEGAHFRRQVKLQSRRFDNK